ncbi:MAG TPA: SagB family peptide dehydrogenase [Nocardioidaceae bacterium]|nr:SagB family peptide dehydrogenase [Nocardioidaceae bacterium]
MNARRSRGPSRSRLWSLSEHTLVEDLPESDQLVVLTRWGEIVIEDRSPVVAESLQRMSLGPIHLENVPTLARDPHGDPAHQLSHVLERLGCCVVQSLGLDADTGPMLSVVPVTREARFWDPPHVEPDRPIVLSRFATIRPGKGSLLLESPLTDFSVVLHRPKAAYVVSALAQATSIEGLRSQTILAEPVLADLVSYLVASGIVQVGHRDLADGQPHFDEDDDSSLDAWSYYDLEFHARTRLSRYDTELTPASQSERLPVEPVVKPPPDGPRFPLHRPDLELADDLSLTEAIENRRSSFDFSPRPVSASAIGELLFRVARIRWTRLTRTGDGVEYVVSDRPYPSTADLYELELYVSLDRCPELPRGTFHYDPGAHSLTLVDDSEPALAELLDTAKIAAGCSFRPPVLVTMTSRIARLSWLYGTIAYSLTLKHVGELQQTFLLVATAMGLACQAPAIIDGTADEALRLDWPNEVSVGEFLVGFEHEPGR